MSMASTTWEVADQLHRTTERFMPSGWVPAPLHCFNKHLGVWIVALHRRALWPSIKPTRLGTFYDCEDFADAVCASCYVPIGLTKWFWTSACGASLPLIADLPA